MRIKTIEDHLPRLGRSGCRRALLALVAPGLLSLSAWGGPIDILFVPRPQFAGNSCRSYALALAAGTLPGTPVPISTVQQLRAAESDLQARLAATAQKMGNAYSAGHHEVWKRAVTEMTSGALEAVVEYKPTIGAFYSRLEELTGNGRAETLDGLLSSIVAKTPVMTSVTGIGKDQYSPSHIVTLYGVAGAKPGLSAQRAVAVLNPAVKTPDKQRNICDLDGVRNDVRWSAVVSLEPAYKLNRFPDGYLVMWVRKR